MKVQKGFQIRWKVTSFLTLHGTEGRRAVYYYAVHLQRDGLHCEGLYILTRFKPFHNVTLLLMGILWENL